MVCRVNRRLALSAIWRPFLNGKAQLTTKALAFTEHLLKASAADPAYTTHAP